MREERPPAAAAPPHRLRTRRGARPPSPQACARDRHRHKGPERHRDGQREPLAAEGQAVGVRFGRAPPEEPCPDDVRHRRPAQRAGRAQQAPPRREGFHEGGQGRVKQERPRRRIVEDRPQDEEGRQPPPRVRDRKIGIGAGEPQRRDQTDRGRERLLVSTPERQQQRGRHQRKPARPRRARLPQEQVRAQGGQRSEEHQDGRPDRPLVAHSRQEPRRVRDRAARFSQELPQELLVEVEDRVLSVADEVRSHPEPEIKIPGAEERGRIEREVDPVPRGHLPLGRHARLSPEAPRRPWLPARHDQDRRPARCPAYALSSEMTVVCFPRGPLRPRFQARPRCFAGRLRNDEMVPTEPEDDIPCIPASRQIQSTFPAEGRHEILSETTWAAVHPAGGRGRRRLRRAIGRDRPRLPPGPAPVGRGGGLPGLQGRRRQHRHQPQRPGRPEHHPHRAWQRRGPRRDGLRPHERPCAASRRPGRGRPAGRQGLSRPRRRRRRDPRPGDPQDRTRDAPEADYPRPQPRPHGRRTRGLPGQPVRHGPDGLGRHRQCPRPPHAVGLHVPPRHDPDGRQHQPRQFGRPPGQRPRRDGRPQHHHETRRQQHRLLHSRRPDPRGAARGPRPRRARGLRPGDAGRGRRPRARHGGGRGFPGSRRRRGQETSSSASGARPFRGASTSTSPCWRYAAARRCPSDSCGRTASST